MVVNMSHPTSPALTGQFSEEDIQELLGAMGGSHTESSQVPAETASASSTSSKQLVPAKQEEPALPPLDSQEVQQARHSQSEDASNPPSDSETVKALARSERKRSREKQRRSDVNKQFTELTQLLQRIDADDKKEAEEENQTANSFLATFNPSNRVDLIARTVALLERLHDSNKRRRVEVKKLGGDLVNTKKAGEETAARLKEAMCSPAFPTNNGKFMMMVPMMMDQNGGGQAPMMGGHNPMMMPPYMQPSFNPFTQMSSTTVAAPLPPVAAPAPTTLGSNGTQGAHTNNSNQMAATFMQPQQQQLTQQQVPWIMPNMGNNMMMAFPSGATTANPSPGNMLASRTSGVSAGMSLVTSAQNGLQNVDPQNVAGRGQNDPQSSGNLAHCA